LFLGLSLLLGACGPGSRVANEPALTNDTVPSPSPANDSYVQTVTIYSPDGVELVGSLFKASQLHSPAVLLLHQWESDRHSYDDFARQMQKLGFTVLAIDGRGFGGSTMTRDGKPVSAERNNDAVQAMLADVRSAFYFLAKQENVNPYKIAIVGASYSSSLALIYGAKDKQVAAVGLLSPGLNYFGNMPTEPAIKDFGDRDIVLIAAEDDKESADAARNLGANNSKAMTRVLARGGHGTALLGAPEDPNANEILRDFLVSRLGSFIN